MDHRHQHYLRQHNPARPGDHHDGLDVPVIMTGGPAFVPAFQDKLKTAASNGNGNGNGNGNANRTASAGICMEQEMGAAEVMTTGNSGLLPSKLRGGGKGVRYRECLKNHAAHLGRQATDGCGEFIPSGEEGTLEALKCAACDCHRNFHRREMEGEPPSCADCRKLKHQQQQQQLPQQPLPMAVSAAPGPPPLMAATPVSYGTRPPPQMIMAMNNGSARPELDEREGGATGGGGRLSGYGMNMSPGSSAAVMMAQMMRKRHRTKFTSAQKELMHEFAERVGWRIQKHDEEAVQRLCAEVGVKRHVLKVWMHNNKNTYSASTRTNPGNNTNISSSNNNDNNNNDMNMDEDDDEDDDEDESNSREDLPLIQPG